MVQPWQAPAPMVGPGGKASPEWLRWLQQLLAAGASIDANSADITALKGEIGTANAELTALQALVATLQAAGLVLEVNGALAGSQKLLNLIAGPNIGLSDNGAGDITITASAGAGSYVEETPGGTLDGANTNFSLSYIPKAGALALFRNGVEQDLGRWYTLAGNVITFTVAPKATDRIFAQYTH